MGMIMFACIIALVIFCGPISGIKVLIKYMFTIGFVTIFCGLIGLFTMGDFFTGASFGGVVTTISCILYCLKIAKKKMK